jgi:NADPH-dependent curcumin reductase CurA
MVQNKNLIFKQIPTGLPVPGKDLVVETKEFDVEQAPPGGGLTTKALYVSFDPYMRGRMRSPEEKSYSPPFTLGEPITSNAISKVLKSDAPNFKPGDLVHGNVAVGEYSIISKDAVKGLRKIENPYNLDLIDFLGAMGMPGLTAYSSLYDIGKPVKGETIFISAASGAVGQGK